MKERKDKMAVFQCEVVRANVMCGGNIVKMVSRGEQVLKCDKCGREIPLRDFENELDSNPATMGEKWFRR